MPTRSRENYEAYNFLIGRDFFSDTFSEKSSCSFLQVNFLVPDPYLIIQVTILKYDKILETIVIWMERRWKQRDSFERYHYMGEIYK